MLASSMFSVIFNSPSLNHSITGIFSPLPENFQFKVSDHFFCQINLSAILPQNSSGVSQLAL